MKGGDGWEVEGGGLRVSTGVILGQHFFAADATIEKKSSSEI